MEIRAISIDKIDFPITDEGNTANILLEYMSEDEREVRLRKALQIAGSFFEEQIPEISKKNIILRLWSECLDAVRSISRETRDGTTSPDSRKAHFFQIDIFAKWDSIYCAGVQTAPALNYKYISKFIN